MGMQYSFFYKRRKYERQVHPYHDLHNHCPGICPSKRGDYMIEDRWKSNLWENNPELLEYTADLEHKIEVAVEALEYVLEENKNSYEFYETEYLKEKLAILKGGSMREPISAYDEWDSSEEKDWCCPREEVRALEKDYSDLEHKLEVAVGKLNEIEYIMNKSRIWGGMKWTQLPIMQKHAERIRTSLTEALAILKGEQR